MSDSINITEKKYKKLVLQVSQSGFKYGCFDTLSNSLLFMKSIAFDNYPKAANVTDHYWKAFVDNSELTKNYDEVIVIHENSLNTFVPQQLFDEDLLGSYLQYNTQVFETDFFAFDELPNCAINNVYIPYVNINNFLIDQFGPFVYKSASSILVSKLMDLSKNKDDKQVYAHFSSGKFEIVVLQNQNLLLYNSFDYKTKEDFLYYLLFTAEQLNLNPETFKLYLLGAISEEHEIYKFAYKYVRDIVLLDVATEMQKNNLTKSENLEHYIVLQSWE